MTGPTVRDLTAAHVTRLAREAVFGNARFTTTTIALGKFRTRPLAECIAGLSVKSVVLLLNEVVAYFQRFGYEATVDHAPGGTIGSYVVTVTDTSRREREVAEQEAKREAALAKAAAESPAATRAELEYDGGRTAQAAAELSAAPDRLSCGQCGEPVVKAADGSWGHVNPALDGHPEQRAALYAADRAAARETTVEQRVEAVPEAPGGVGYVEPEASFDGVPYTTEESRAHLEAGFSLVGRHGGYRSCTVRDRRQGDRELGTVSAVTESLGRGVWVRFAAYRRDGSRVGYAGTRLEAAELLRAEYPAPGPVSLSDTLVSGERVVRRDGEELGTVRRERGRVARWQAWDSDGTRRVDSAETSEEAARLLVEGIDRRAAQRAETEAWMDRESAAMAPAEVLPSGRYGVRYDTAHTYVGPEPVLHVVQRFDNGRWGATPGRWTASTLAGRADLGSLSIDAGAGWGLDAADTARLVELAREALSGV